MNVLRKVGSLGVAMIIAVGSLVLGAAPASAAGYTHYENVGNRGWCLDGNGVNAYLHACGHGGRDYQLWKYTADRDYLQLKHVVSGTCLRALSPYAVALGECTGSESRWDAVGNGTGWVMLWHTEHARCLIPYRTDVPGLEVYPVGLEQCPPRDLSNVPNLYAWRYIS